MGNNMIIIILCVSVIAVAIGCAWFENKGKSTDKKEVNEFSEEKNIENKE